MKNTQNTQREYNRFVANETIEDYSLRYTPKSFRKWSEFLIANTAIGSISFLALEAIGASIAFKYGFSTAFWAILTASIIIFLTAIPISYHSAKYNIDIDLLTRSAGFGYIGSTITSLIYASFSFIFFALEAAIMAQAFELYFALPLAWGYLLSSIIIIPMVFYGITFINKLQIWTQPVWITMMIAPFVAVMLKEPEAIQSFISLTGDISSSSDFNIHYFGFAVGISLSLIAQIGEQVDYLRFMPPLEKKNRIKWWLAMLSAGPGWIIIGFLKQMGGIFLASIVLLSGLSIYEAKTPIQMYYTGYQYIFDNTEVAIAAATFFVIISQIKINVTNAYAGSLAWSNFFSRITHSHPGRVVWMIFNISIALLLMELGVFDVLEKVLGLYSNVAISWIGALTADLLINKPFGLSPKIIEFKRAHLYNINPVGIGSMGIASFISILCFVGIFGEIAQSYSAILALILSFVLAPIFAYLTGGKYYIARQSDFEGSDAKSIQCLVCDNEYEKEDMSYCPFHEVNICSLCCSLESTCKDMCKEKNESNFRTKITIFMKSIFFHKLSSTASIRVFDFSVITSIILFVLSISFWMVLSSSANDVSEETLLYLSDSFFTLFFIIAILVTIVVWWFLLLQESKSIAEKTLAEKNKKLKNTTELFKENSERLDLAINGNNDGVWDWDLLKNTMYYSHRWKEMLGYEDHELLNEYSTWEELMHPEDLQPALDLLQKHLDGHTEYFEALTRMEHKDSHWIWVLCRAKAIRDENNKPVRIIGTHTDITKKKEKELQALHQTQIIEQINDSVISTDLDGNIVSWNYGAQRLYEFTQEEAIGKHISIIYIDNDTSALNSDLYELMKTGSYHEEVTLIKKSKEPVEVDLSLSILRDENGVPTNLVGYSLDISKRKEVESKLLSQTKALEHQAHHDYLTSLPNRVLFNKRVEQAIAKAIRHKTSMALFFIDLDMFKQVNDSLGHLAGDKLLQQVAFRLKTTIRKEDSLARLGGDEFTVLIEDITKQEDASLLAQKILSALEKSYYVDGHKLYISSSIGISIFPQDTKKIDELFMYADGALYKAKDEGRNNFQYHSAEMTGKALKRVKLESELREALANDEFQVYYQVQINTEDDSLIGMEALIRWVHPTRGLIPPIEFIPMAEESSLIVEIDRYAMKKAMKQIFSWRQDGLNPGKLALNLAVKQLNKKDFISVLKSTCKEVGFKYEWLELEITESEVMKNPKEAIATLNSLSKLGIELSIDDFGTGYSSLSYLKKLPIDKVKIDKSFVDGLPYDEDDASISKAIIALAKSLNLDIIAEGVENKEQKDFLVENGCKNIQGYYYAKPMPANEMQDYLLKLN